MICGLSTFRRFVRKLLVSSCLCKLCSLLTNVTIKTHFNLSVRKLLINLIVGYVIFSLTELPISRYIFFLYIFLAQCFFRNRMEIIVNMNRLDLGLQDVLDISCKCSMWICDIRFMVWNSLLIQDKISCKFYKSKYK